LGNLVSRIYIVTLTFSKIRSLWERKRPTRLRKPERSFNTSEAELSKVDIDYTRFSVLEGYENWIKALKNIPK
jgi:hypothetical protein